VFSGLVTACRLAAMPTRRVESSVMATTEGVVRAPSEFSMTRALRPSCHSVGINDVMSSIDAIFQSTDLYI
jgi:hypothetical protein